MAQLRYVLLAVTLVVLIGVSAVAVNVPNAFVAGETISASEMNANFAALEAAVAALEASAAALEATQSVVAHAKRDLTVDFAAATTEAADLVVVELTVPAAGVVVVEAAMQTGYNGTVEPNRGVLTIDTDAGGTVSIAGSESFVFGASAPSGPSTFFAPAALRRVFSVEAGTHTFRLKGFNESGTGNKYVFNPSITATWYPASRASVSAVSTSVGTQSRSGQDR